MTVRPPEGLGRVIATALDVAGTGIAVHNVSFDIDDRTSLTSLARRDAVTRDLNASRELAEAAGLVLGPLLARVSWLSPEAPEHGSGGTFQIRP